MLQKAACSGWGKLYFTDDYLPGEEAGDSPLWDNLATFWDYLVSEASNDVMITCPDAENSRLRIMVPLLPSSSSSEAGECTL